MLGVIAVACMHGRPELLVWLQQCLHWIIFDQVLDFLLILSELSGLVADKANYGDEDNGMGSTIQHCGFDDVVANFLAM